MKTKDAAKAQGWSKQKKQFAALGVLSAVLVAVMFGQFRESETDYQVAALSEDAVLTAAEPEVDPNAAPAVPAAQDNPVLSLAPDELELTRNPFTSFWNRDTSEEAQVPLVPPPSLALNLTMPGGPRPVAVIDGELHFVGDLVQGWTLEAVRARAIVLRSPDGESLVVEMPLFQRELSPPEPADSALAAPGGGLR